MAAFSCFATLAIPEATSVGLLSLPTCIAGPHTANALAACAWQHALATVPAPTHHALSQFASRTRSNTPVVLAW